MKNLIFTAGLICLSNFTNAQQITPSCFTHAIDYPVNYPYDINNGDYNGDGYDDYAVINLFNDSISVYLNSAVPNGFNFQNPLVFTTLEFPKAMATGDFNNDGYSDLACLNGNQFSPQELKLLYGSSSGLTASSIPMPLNSDPANQTFTKINLGDLNNDGFEDMVITTTNNSNSLVYIFINNAGTFSTAQTMSVSSSSSSNLGPADLIDFTGDGNIDYVSLLFQNPGGTSLGIKEGLGDGTFSNNLVAVPIPFNDIQHIECEDLNNDGLGDMILGGLSGKLAILTLNSSGFFDAPIVFTNLTGSAYDLEFVDINNDGFKDIIASGVNSNSFNILYGSSTYLQFSIPYTYNSGTVFAERFAIGDYNLDGLKEILTCNTASNTVGLNINLNPTITPPVSTTFCEGTMANLFSQHPFANEFQWLPSGGTSSSANIFSSGNYTLTLTDTPSNCSITSTPISLTFNDCTGIEENENLENSYVVYPNPATNGVIVSSSNNIEEIRIFDYLGKEMLVQNCNNFEVSIDLSSLIDGIYFISINGLTQKIIKE